MSILSQEPIEGFTVSETELYAILEPEGSFSLEWQKVYIKPQDAEKQHTLYEIYKQDPWEAVLYLGMHYHPSSLPDSLVFLYRLSSCFIQSLLQNPDLESFRDKAQAVIETEQLEELISESPYIQGMELLNGPWLEKALKEINSAYSRLITVYRGTVAEFFRSVNPTFHLSGRIYFHLVESKEEGFPFAFMSTYSAEASPDGKGQHLPLKNALVQYGDNSQKLLELLSTVYKAAEESSFIKELLDSGDMFYPIALSPQEAYTFLKEIPLYEQAGIICRIPDWWRKKSTSPRIQIKVGSKTPSYLGASALLNYDIALSLGGISLTYEEMKKISEESSGLVYLKGKWVEADPQKLRETLEVFKKALQQTRDGLLSLTDAIRLQFASDSLLKLPEAQDNITVAHGLWLEDMLEKLRNPEKIEAPQLETDFKADLREYQKRGLSWLAMMKTLGLGACLADDMGLGKTLQVLALLHVTMKQRPEKVLIIVPASLIGNWTGEISRFAPNLPFKVLHSKEAADFNSASTGEGIYITTYGMAVRLKELSEVQWDMVVLDEAQAIKNPGTRQTQAVKRLPAVFRVALTGTPVENRLGDLWSLFDFLNKGLLGSAKEFNRLSQKLKEKPDGYSALKQTLSPFIMRRLKTDKSIINDLPEKIEMKSYTHLSKRQAALYTGLVNELEHKLNTSEGIQRKGLILASLTAFKQICNHSDQYLGQESFLPEDSGKFQRLREICEVINEKRERVLIFTQFKSMAEPLSNYLEALFGRKGLLLHGDTPVPARKQIVEKFQGNTYIPYMVLSIKAGGVGLNLTAANHVIHFDRWWNPAVENQATDRAFRIGQKKKVLVHKFITLGTIEEKIDKLIEVKSSLTNSLIPDKNESWITEMDNQQLMKLFRLE